jgi:hypothetical protein
MTFSCPYDGWATGQTVRLTGTVVDVENEL